MKFILDFLRKFELLMSSYHFTLAFLAAAFYGFPSKKMTVIGVTGTKGKTTTSTLIYDILRAAGFKTGLATTVNFRVGEKEWANDAKQTMLGRFGLQKLLSEMAKNGCAYAVIETSSEGIAQHRQRFIDYKTGVFTNLSPEHIERHGGFDNYRAAKVKLFEQIARRKDGVGIYNLDDENAGYFLKPAIAEKYGYAGANGLAARGFAERDKVQAAGGLDRIFKIENIRLGENGSKFSFDGQEYETPLLGEFNVYNAAAAIAAALSENISRDAIAKALKETKNPSGRFDVAESGRGFRIVIDYAHEPKSLEAVYEAVRIFKPKRIICLLGAQGGGRDKWKRAAMGKIAAEKCDEVIITNEDPYDEPPEKIIDEVASGASQAAGSGTRIHKIVDRRAAIKTAISLAGKDDVVVLTGKGGEAWMCVEKGRKIPWDEKKVAGEILEGRT